MKTYKTITLTASQDFVEVQGDAGCDTASFPNILHIGDRQIEGFIYGAYNEERSWNDTVNSYNKTR